LLKAAALEEKLALHAETDGDPLRAARSHFSAASAWVNAGDFYHALELLQTFEERPDAPVPLPKLCALSVANGRTHFSKQV